MMTSQPLTPILVENQVINWKVVSGTAVGVHKYTKTHVSSGGEYPTYSSAFEIIVECSIHQDDGEEIPVKLSTWEPALRAMNWKEGFEEIRVRDGQHISVICGYTDKRSSDWLILINHDHKKWYWLNFHDNNWYVCLCCDIPQIGKFLDDLSIFKGSLLKKCLWRIERFFVSLWTFFIQWLLWSFSVWMLVLSLYMFLSSFLIWIFHIAVGTYPFSSFNPFNFLWMVCIGIAIGYILLFKIWKEQINQSRQIVKLQIAEMARSLL